MRNHRRRRDQDSPWKTLITLFFPQLIQLIHPELYALIDWQRGYQFLDSELRKIAPRSRTGRQTVDKLVQVYLRDGSEYWILIHIEAQSHPDPDFEARMFTYYATLWILYRRPIVSIAILADNEPNWRPSTFTQSLGGCRLEFNFYTVKLLDMDEAQLLNNPNPCALILAAFRRAMRADTAEFMLASRMELVRLALDRGYTEEQVENLIRLLEWVMVLPEVLEERYEQFLEEVKREQNTPYLSVLERKALREGWEQGVQKGLQEGHEKGLQEGRAQGLQARSYRTVIQRSPAHRPDSANRYPDAELGRPADRGRRWAISGAHVPRPRADPAALPGATRQVYRAPAHAQDPEEVCPNRRRLTHLLLDPASGSADGEVAGSDLAGDSPAPLLYCISLRRPPDC
jgi:hypothetical protein